MKSEKGVTLTTLIIYLILLMLVISLLSLVTQYFNDNLKYVGDTGKYVTEFNKFNMYFIEDVKNNKDASIQSNTKIVFDDGTTYTFTDNSIYRNKVKICQNIYAVVFTKTEEVDSNNFTKKIIRVNMAIRGSKLFQTENEYVLKYW